MQINRDHTIMLFLLFSKSRRRLVRRLQKIIGERTLRRVIRLLSGVFEKHRGAFFADMIQGALVLALTMNGIIDARQKN